MKRVLVEIIAAVVLAVGGGLLMWGSSFATGMVHDQLSDQHIVFPAKGSPGFDAATYPDLQQYAGQVVDDGPKAKAYANGYIGRHLKGVADGKTYSEMSALSRANPNDTTLAGQVQTLFRGETLRGLLLYAWGWWLVGRIAFGVSIFLFVAAVGLVAAALITRPRHALRHAAAAAPESGRVDEVEETKTLVTV